MSLVEVMGSQDIGLFASFDKFLLDSNVLMDLESRLLYPGFVAVGVTELVNVPVVNDHCQRVEEHCLAHERHEWQERSHTDAWHLSSFSSWIDIIHYEAKIGGEEGVERVYQEERVVHAEKHDAVRLFRVQEEQ